jgi:rhodanese-related sulfurtransferase
MQTIIPLVVFLLVRLSGLGYGLGVVQVNQETLFDLRYTNTSDQTQEIAQITARCSCITILEYPRQIAPGASIDIPCMHRSDIPGSIATQVELSATLGTTDVAPFAVLPVYGVVTRPEWLLTRKELEVTNAPASWIVDIRPEEDYAKLRILGASSVPRFTLLNRKDLKDKRIVLYDEGFDRVGILSDVATLRAEGFKEVYALADGLSGWLRASGKVQGRYASRVPSASLSPWLFSGVKLTGTWKTLLIQTGNKASSSEYDFIVDTFSAAKDLLEKNSIPPRSEQWLVLSNDMNDYERLEVSLKPELWNRTFYLAGGNSSWENFNHVMKIAASGNGGRRQTESVNTHSGLPAPHIGARSCGSCGK